MTSKAAVSAVAAVRVTGRGGRRLPAGFAKSFLYEPQTSQLPPTSATLGLDVNTASTGWTLLGHDGNVVDAGVIDTAHCPDAVSFGAAFTQSLEEIQAREYAALAAPCERQWLIGVEQYLKTFFGRGRNTHSLFMLAEVNSLVRFISWQQLQPALEPLLIHPNQARAVLGASFGIESKRDNKKIKEAVYEAVQPLFPPQFAWPSRKDQSFDIADSFCVARATQRQALLRQTSDDEAEFESFCAHLLPAVEQHYASKPYPDGMERKPYSEADLRRFFLKWVEQQTCF